MLEVDKAKAAFLKPHALGGYLGAPYEENGCIKFLYKALDLIGIPTSGVITNQITVEEYYKKIRKDGRHWKRIDGKPQYGDVAVFQALQFAKYHVGLMLDSRHMIQSSSATSGVARIEIDREPWIFALRGIYRHKQCS